MQKWFSVQFHTQPLHLTLQELCLFVQMSLFLLLSDHDQRVLYCCFSKRQLVFLRQFLFSYLSLIHKRFCTNITLNNYLRLLCTMKSNSMMWTEAFKPQPCYISNQFICNYTEIKRTLHKSRHLPTCLDEQIFISFKLHAKLCKILIFL